MSDFQADLRDMRFVLFEQVGVDKLFQFPAFAELDREAVEMTIDMAYRMAKDKLAPLNIVGDRQGCRFENGNVYMPPGFKALFKEFAENGWVGPTAPPELGGGGLPASVALAANEMFTGSGCAFLMTPGLTMEAANLLREFGSPKMKELYLQPMYSGQWGGTMCLTESGAGSAVGDLKTTAKPVGDHYLIEGEKIFISSGEHDLTENIIHLVLARTPNSPKGTAGISLFLVPKFLVNDDGSLGARNGVVCTKIEEKMGLHGSSTCVLAFGADAPCIGYLVGEELQGIRYMFKMMNAARLLVGLQGMSLAGAAYQYALAYAKERIQGTDIREMKDPDARRVPIIEHPDVRRMLMTMRAYHEGMRALIVKAAFYEDMAEHAPEGERDLYKGLLDFVTPICKSYCSDMAFRVSELGIQVLGGYGYIAEYPLEQICRDTKITSLYEGTTGIQALDLLGRKVGGKGGLLFMQWLQHANGIIEAAQKNPRLADLCKAVDDAKNELADITFLFAGLGRKDPLYPVLNAVPLLYIFGDVMVAIELLQQAAIADEKFEAACAEAGATDPAAKRKVAEERAEAQFYYNKIQTANFFVKRLLPNAYAYIMGIRSRDKSCLDVIWPAA